MAFESVNVTSLRNALNQCKNTINHSSTTELITSISNTSVWQSSSQKKLKTALTKLENERYKDLENKINKYLEVVSYIERYKELQRENISLENHYYNLSRRLHYTVYYDETITQPDGSKFVQHHSRTETDHGVEREMNSVIGRIDNNKNEMEEYKNKVSNSI